MLLENHNAIESGGYQIANSLRFQSASSQYLSRTPSVAGNQQKWTWSGWVKRGALGSNQTLISTSASLGSNSGVFQLAFTLNNTLEVFVYSTPTTYGDVITTQVFRDPSAWYHIVVTVDTTQATAANRIIVYVNGVQVTSYSTATYPSQNFNCYLNGTTPTYLGGYTASGNPSPVFDGYMTEVNFIDGVSLTPSSFGEFDSLTGQWVAKKYTGTYGTNGFYLPFSNGTSTTTLGADSSGNGNNWTLTNFTRSAGVSDCWMYDVPSGNGSAGTQPNSNYCVLSPIDKDNTVTISRGNLTQTSSAGGSAKSSIFIPTTGKWYAEYICTVGSTISLKIQNYAGKYIGYLNSGSKETSGGTTAYGASWTTNDVIGVAVDCDTSQVTFYKNNASQGAIAFSVDSLTSENLFFTNYTANSSATVNANFGQRSFAYTPPSGFKALCTANLPASTIVKGNQYMDATLYTGNGSNQNLTGINFQPDIFWGKSRSAVNNHGVVDSVRGGTAAIYTNLTNAEGADGIVNSFNSNGVSLGNSATTNANGQSFVGWMWDAGSTTVSNSSGTIASQVRANPTAGVSVVTYTGNGTAGATIGHGLGVAPKMVIVKRRDSGVDDWCVYHASIGNTGRVRLNTTAATQTNILFWNNTSPTSSVFTIGADSGVNVNTSTYVAYCFAEIAGFSKFSSYTGNGSADGTFVYTGFRPKFVLVKRTDTTGNWRLVDTSRGTFNATQYELYPNLANAEGTATYDILSNGFKNRETSADYNASGGTYIYMAFAENPFQNSNAR